MIGAAQLDFHDSAAVRGAIGKVEGWRAKSIAMVLGLLSCLKRMNWMTTEVNANVQLCAR
jgi:hypothetical protein